MEQVHILPYFDSAASGDNAERLPRYTFPYKLWVILNEPYSRDRLLWWSDSGTEVIADPIQFEQSVMERYPEFVRIPTFANFRRQMRWYNFTWEVDELGRFHFKNSDFQRSRSDLLGNVLSKRTNGRKSRSPKADGDGPRRYKRRKQASHEFDIDFSDTSSVSTENIIFKHDIALQHIDATNSTTAVTAAASSSAKRSIAKSANKATQTSFTMSPYNTEFVGTINNGIHYFDFYSLDFSSNYPNFLPQYNALLPYALPAGATVVSSDASTSGADVSLAGIPMSNSTVQLTNAFAPFSAESLSSPDDLCLQGFPKPVLMDSQLQSAPTPTSIASMCVEQPKDSFTDL